MQRRQEKEMSLCRDCFGIQPDTTYWRNTLFYVFRYSKVFSPVELTSLFFHFIHKICQPLILHITFTFSIHKGTKSQTNCVCMCVCSWCLSLLGASISCKHHLLTTGSPASKHLTNKHTHKYIPACHWVAKSLL